MGFRHYVGRTLWLLALALAVGIAVAIMGGEERASPAHGGIPPIGHHAADGALAAATGACLHRA